MTEFSQAFIPKLGAAVQDAVKEYPLIWMQMASCSGCSVSVINTVHPSIKNAILDKILPSKQITLAHHETLMAATGQAAIDAAVETSSKNKGKYIYVIEGAVPTKDDGIFGSVGEENGKPVTMLSWLRRLAPDAMAVMAVGTCAAFGGVVAAEPNPTGGTGVGDAMKMFNISTPFINLPGCPCHPDWFIGTVASVLLYGLPKAEDLDKFSRPKAYYGKTIHSCCTKRGLLEDGVLATQLGEEGCLMGVGCKGPETFADCPVRQWNAGASYCIRAHAPCIGCTQPDFHGVE
jgi:hydrogenase small subunit